MHHIKHTNAISFEFSFTFRLANFLRLLYSWNWFQNTQNCLLLLLLFLGFVGCLLLLLFHFVTRWLSVGSHSTECMTSGFNIRYTWNHPITNPIPYIFLSLSLARRHTLHLNINAERAVSKESLGLRKTERANLFGNKPRNFFPVINFINVCRRLTHCFSTRFS